MRQGMNRTIIDGISRVIEDQNPLYLQNRTACECLDAWNSGQEETGVNMERRAVIDVNCRLIIWEGADRRRGNLPTVPEVALILPHVSYNNVKKIIFFQRNGDRTLSTRFQYIHRGHLVYLPLHYALFNPFGKTGYRWDMPLKRRPRRVLGNMKEQDIDRVTGGCISAHQFYKYHIFSRWDSTSCTTKFNTLTHGERLFEQLLCDMYAYVDDNTLT